MNVPNMLTISRFLLIPVYIYVFFTGYKGVAFLVVLLAGLTDILDGYLARRNDQITEVGKMLDPLADKSMMIVVILSLLVTGYIPWIAAAAVFARDIGMIIGSAFFHFSGKKTVPANAMGKLTTVLYYSALLFIVLRFDFAITYLWFVIIFSILTSTVYVVQFQSLNRNT